MIKSIINFFKDEEGATAVEYALLAGLIAIVIIVALVALGPKIRNVFNSASDGLGNATGGGGGE
ncbi:MAG: Flp family type IVb pilin [bacterium]